MLNRIIKIGELPFKLAHYLNILDEFKNLYYKRPIKNNVGGMRSQNMFWLWSTVKLFQPKTIIESGVWKGQSTWLLRNAAPTAKIYCFDPTPPWQHNEYYKDELAEYFIDDFSNFDFDNNDIFAFFDDHQNKVERIKQCKEKGINNLFFDDNYETNVDHLTLSHVFNILRNGSDYNYLVEYLETYIVFPSLFKLNSGDYYRKDMMLFDKRSFSFDSPLNIENYSEYYSLFSEYQNEYGYNYHWPTYVKIK